MTHVVHASTSVPMTVGATVGDVAGGVDRAPHPVGRGVDDVAALEAANRALLARSRLLAVVADVSTLLARTADLRAALLESLRRLGDAAGLDRVVLFEERAGADGTTPAAHHVVAEWCAAGVADHAALGMCVIPSTDAPAWVEMLRRGEAFWVRTEELDDPLRAVLRRLGVWSTGCAPLFVDGAYAGAVAFDHCTAAHAWDAAEVAALTAGANAIAAALQARRHAERLALAREQSARAQVEELTRANVVLHRSLDTLASRGALDRVVDDVLAAVGEHAGADGATCWIVDVGAGTYELSAVWEPGRSVIQAAASDHPARGVAQPLPALGPLSVEMLARGETVAVADILSDSQLPPAVRRHLIERGFRSLLFVPLALAGETLGAFVVRYRSVGTPALARLELVRALAQQASLALHLTRLGTRARDAAVTAAVARERQAAAEERASALAAEVSRRAHAERVATGQAAVLMRAVERLAAATPEPASVTSTAAAVRDALLAAVVEQLDGARVDLWTFDLERDECRLAITCHADGRLVAGVDQPSHPGSRVIPLAAMRESPGYVAMVRGECLRVGPDYDHPTHAPFRVWMDEQGLQSALQVPVRVGGVARAVFFVLCVDDRPFPPEERELAMAVGHLLALAFEAERLAEEAHAAARQSAVLEERARIARELHDTMAQGLTGIVMQLGVVRDKLADAGEARARVAAPLARAAQLAQENLAAARRAITVLRPDARADEGIAAALARMVAEARRDWAAHEREHGGESPPADGRPTLAYDVRGTPRRVAPEVEFELARIAQAALANAVRHARATSIVATLDFAAGAGDGVRIAVTDDGVGFDPGAPMDGHFGLVGMRERAARIGAAMTVVTAPGEGTEVVVMWTAAAT